MFIHIFAQLPTPTSLPPGMPIVMLDPHDFNIWSRTGDAIQIWNYEPRLGLMIQTAVLLILIGAFMGVLFKQLRKLQNEEL